MAVRQKAPFPTPDVLFKMSGEVLEPFARLFPGARVDLSPPLFHSQGFSKTLGGSMNEAMLQKRPFYSEEVGLIVVPLLMDDRVAGLVTVEGVEENPLGGLDAALMELGKLTVQRAALSSLYFDPPASGLYRREPFEEGLVRAMAQSTRAGCLGHSHPRGFALVAMSPLGEEQAGEAAGRLPEGGMARLEGDALLAMLPGAELDGVVELLQELSQRLEGPGFAAGITLYPTDLLAEVGEGGDFKVRAGEIVERAEFALRAAAARGSGVYLTFEEASDIVSGAPGRPRFLREAGEILADTESFAILMVRLEGLKKELGSLDLPGVQGRLAECGSFVLDLLEEAEVAAVWKWDTLGVFLRGVDESGAVERARLLVEEAGAGFGAELTVGIAVHPYHHFGPEDAVTNAARALTHAGFFGPGAVQPFDAVSLNIAGDRLLAVGDEEGAVALLELALELDPKETNVLNSLGVLYGQRGELENARSYFQRARDADPSHFMAEYNLGSVEVALGNSGEALERFLRACEIDRDRTEACLMAGRLLVEEARFPEAVDYLKRAYEGGLKDQALCALLGEALLAEGDGAGAEEHLMMALRLNPDDPRSLKLLAKAYLEDNRELDLAASLLARASELDPDDLEVGELVENTRRMIGHDSIKEGG